MITDITYYQNEPLYIANAQDISAVPAGTPVVQSEVEHFIDICERKILMNALGVSLFEELEQIIEDDELNEVGNEHWKALVEGESYEDADGNEYRFEGLKGWQKDSLLAYFVKCEHMRSNEELVTTTGTVKPDSKNSIIVSPTRKFINLWTTFLKMYQGEDVFNDEPAIVVNPDGQTGLNYYRGGARKQRSLLEFITDKNELDSLIFQDFEFRVFGLDEQYNSFGF